MLNRYLTNIYMIIPYLTDPLLMLNWQGSTIDVRRVCTYTYFYWCTHDVGHAYVDMHARFFPYDFSKFAKFSTFFYFILFINLLLKFDL